MNLILGGREENIIKFNHDNEVEWKRSEYLTDTNDSIYVIDLEELENGGSFLRSEKVQEYRWMIEEFKISLFAQELGTRYPISAKRLEKKWEEIQNS